MRSFPVLLVALLSAATLSASTPTLRVPARVVPVYEETAAPGMPSNYYPLCATQDNTDFALEINDASTECAMKTSYDWLGLYLPTASERRELCSCTQLIKQLQEVVVPRCSLYRDGTLYSYGQVIKYAFGLCNVGGGSSSSTTTTTTTTTTTPAATTDIGSYTFAPSPTKNSYTATTSTPQSTSASVFNDDFDLDVKTKKSKSKAPLIGGIIGGIVVVAAAVFGGLWWKKRNADDESSDDDADSGDIKTVATDMAPLSPLDNSTALAFPYAKELTPKANSTTTSSTTGYTF